jgi:predicted DNA-binding mobile mystery protein A
MKDLTIKQLDKKLRIIGSQAHDQMPRLGWLNTIRSSLGMTTKQFGNRLSISQQAAASIEKREADQTITLKSLSNAAKALNCRLVYFLLPEESLEDSIDKQVNKKAIESLMYVSHSMKLENQSVAEEERKYQLDKLKQEIRLKRLSAIWDEK